MSKIQRRYAVTVPIFSDISTISFMRRELGVTNTNKQVTDRTGISYEDTFAERSAALTTFFLPKIALRATLGEKKESRSMKGAGALPARRGQSPDSASCIARSFKRVSPSSASGLESATIPFPAKSLARVPSTSAHRSAIPNSPSPFASTHPTGPL